MSKGKLPKYCFHVVFTLLVAYLLLALIFEGPKAAARLYFLNVLTVLFATSGTYASTYVNLRSRYRTLIGRSLIACSICVLAYNILKLANIL